MKRVVVPVIVLLGLLGLAPVGLASDKSLENALKPYKTKLTTDIAYLATFKNAPSKSKAGAAQKKLSTIKKDLTGAKNAAEGQQASTNKGKTGRTDVIAGLTDALVATKDASSSATAAKAGKASTAKSDAKAAFKEVAKAVPLLETGGKDLKLF